jgi:ABC-type oligopeptide transport system substrate-binding subunit
MRKYFALLMVAALALTMSLAIASCGAKKSEDASTTTPPPAASTTPDTAMADTTMGH